MGGGAKPQVIKKVYRGMVPVVTSARVTHTHVRPRIGSPIHHEIWGHDNNSLLHEFEQMYYNKHRTEIQAE